MSQLKLTPEDLLAGAKVTFEFVIPQSLLHPGKNGPGNSDFSDSKRNINDAQYTASSGDRDKDWVVELRPLTIGTFQLIINAAKQDVGLIPLFMIKEALVEPKLSLEQVKQLHLGLVEFLVENIRQISGLAEKKSP
jgi:hypothetical protein